MEQLTCSYEDYLNLVKTLTPQHWQPAGPDSAGRLQAAGLPPSAFAPVVYLLDYSRRQYIYVGEACFDLMGYTAKQLLEEGLEGYLRKWHPSDYQMINTHVFPASIRFLRDVPLERYRDLVFSYNYRLLNARGEYITILQRSSFIPGPVPGMPQGNLGVTFDITHYKTDPTIVHTIEEVKQHDGRLYNELLYKQVHRVADDLLLSEREQEILRWMGEGFASKQIAQSLGLSLHTVNNHRKNMLRKAGCNTATELLHKAVRCGYL